ncbi:MAG: hypothetical protein M3291_07535 [Actinomycetota bacterium]|nr:hypothetical protein [Actinomycetota bacterium]
MGAATQWENEGGHPVWCSPQHCYRTEDGVRVHEQPPTSWVDDTTGMRFDTRLIAPEDEPAGTVYLELYVTSVSHRRYYAHALLPVAGAQRLRDQLSAHLDAVGAQHLHCESVMSDG